MSIRKITGTTSGLVTKAELQHGPLNVIKATVQQSVLLATLASQMDIIKAGVLQPLLVTAALVDQGLDRFQYLLDFVLVGEQDRAALLLRKSLTDVLTLVDVSEILIIYIERQLFDQLGQTDRQTLQTVLGKNDAFGLIDPVNFNINKRLADQFQMAELAALFIDLPRTDLVAIPNDTIVVSAGYRRGLSSTNLLLADQRAIFDVGLGKNDAFGLVDPLNFSVGKQLAHGFQMADLTGLFIGLPRADLAAISDDSIVVSAGFTRSLASLNLLLGDDQILLAGLGKADVLGLVDPLNFSIVKQLADQFQTPDLTGVADGSTYAFVLSRADITEALESRIISASYRRGLSSTNLLLLDQRTTFDVGLGRLESLAVSEFMDMLRGLAKFEETPISERRFMLVGHPANDATYGTGDASGLFIGLSLLGRDPATVALADVTDLFAGKFLQHATTAVSQTALSLAKQLSDIATVLSLAGVFDGSTFDFQQYRADQVGVAELLVNLIQAQRLVNDLVDPADTLLTRSITKQLLDGADVVEQRAMRLAKALTDDQITEEVAARFFGKPQNDDTQLVDAGHALFIFKDILHDPEMLEQTEFIVLKTNTDDTVTGDEFTRIFDARRTFEHGSILTDAAIVAQLKFLADEYSVSEEFSRRWIIGRVLEDSTAALDSIFKFEQRLPAHSLVVAERIDNFYITKTLADLTQMQDLAGVGDGSLYRMSLDKFELQEITEYRAQRVRFRRRARDGFFHSVSVSDFLGIVIPILQTDEFIVFDNGDDLLFDIGFTFRETPTAEQVFRRQVEFYRYPHHNDIAIAGEGFNSTAPALDDNANSPGPAKSFTTFIPSPTKGDTTSTQVVVGGVQVLENLLQYSESIGGTSWDQGNGSVTISLEDTTFTNPVGGVTGVSRLEPSANNRYIGQLLDANRIIVGQAYTFSVYLYTAPYALAISVDDGSGGFTQSLTVPNISAWTRYSITFTATTTSVKVYIGNASAWDTNEAVFAWGAQVNSGTVAGTYVKTTDAVFASFTPDIRNQTGETANWFLTIDAKASAQYTTTSETVDFVIPNAIFKIRNSVLHNSSVGIIINPKDRDQVGTRDFQTYVLQGGRRVIDDIIIGRGITTGDRVSGFDTLSYSLDYFNNSTTGTTSTAAISPASATNILGVEFGLVGTLDDGYVPYVLPWNISWYGRSTNTIYISTNSYIFFDTYEGSGNASGYSDIWVAAEQSGQGVLSINGRAPTGTGDYIVSSLGVLVTGTAPNRIVSVVYKGFPYNTVPVTDDDYNTWQVQFFEARPWQHSIRMQNTFAIVTPATNTSAAVYSSSAAVNIWTNGYDLQGNAIRDSSDAPIMQIGTSSSFTFATSSYAVTGPVTLIGETTPFFVGARKFETVSAGTTGNSTSFSNLLVWSTDIGNSSWQLSANVTVDRGVTFFANPEGGTGGITRITSQAVTDGGDTPVVYVGQTLSATAVIASTIYNFSFWARTSSGTANFGIGADTAGGSVDFNVLSSITVTNSWQRFNVAFDPSNTSPHVLMGTPSSAAASAFDSTEPPVFVWGAQVTAGSSVSTVHTPTAENRVIAPTRYNNDPVELTSFDVTKLMKRGATSTTSGVTDLFSASTDPVYAGQRLFQGNQGSRRSGDQFERLIVNYDKPIVDDAAPAYNNVVRDFARNLDWQGTYATNLLLSATEMLRQARWRDEDLTQIWNYTTSYTAAFQAITTADQTPVQADGGAGAYDDGVYGPFALSGVFYIAGVPYSHVLVTPNAEVIFGSSSAALVNTYKSVQARLSFSADLVTTSTITLLNTVPSPTTTSITLYDSANPASTTVPLMRFSSTTTLAGFSGWNANIIRVNAASYSDWNYNTNAVPDPGGDGGDGGGGGDGGDGGGGDGGGFGAFAFDGGIGTFAAGSPTSNLIGYLVEVILLRHPQTGAQIIQVYTDYHDITLPASLYGWGSETISVGSLTQKQYQTTLGSKEGWFLASFVPGAAQNRIGWTTGLSRVATISSSAGQHFEFDTSTVKVLFSDVEPPLDNQLPILPTALLYPNPQNSNYRSLSGMTLYNPVAETYYSLFFDNAPAVATPNINLSNAQANAVTGQRYIASVWINPRDYQPNRIAYGTYSPFTDAIFEVSVYGTVIRDGLEYLSQSSVGTVFFGLTAVTTGSVTYAGLEVVSSVGVMISNTTIKTYPLWYNAQGRLEGLETLGAQDFDASYFGFGEPAQSGGVGGVWHRVSFVYTVQSSITSIYSGRAGGTVYDARGAPTLDTATNLYLRVGRRARHGGQILNVSGPQYYTYAPYYSEALFAAPQLELAPRTQTLPGRYINSADWQYIHPAISESSTTSGTGTWERIQQFGKVNTDNVGVNTNTAYASLPANFLSSSLIWASSFGLTAFSTLVTTSNSSITDIEYYLGSQTGLRFIQTDVVTTSNSFTWTGLYGLRDQLESGENFVLQYRAVNSSSWVTSLTLWTGGTNWSTSIVNGLLAFTATLVTAATTSLAWRFAVSGAEPGFDQVLIRNPVLTINSSSQLISISSTVGIADSMSATGTEQFFDDFSTGIATRTALTDREASLFNKGLRDIPLLGRGTTSETYPERRSDDNLDTAKFLITKRASQGANSTFTGAFTSVASISSTAERIFIGDPSLAPRRSGASLENISYFVDKAAKYGRPATTVTIQTIQGNNGAASSVATTQTTSSADLVGTLSAYRDAVTYFRYPWYPTFDGEPGAFDNLVLPGDDSANSPYPAKLLRKRARLDDGSMGTSSAVMLSQDALFFDKRAKRGVAGTVRLNTIDPNPDVEFAVSSVLVSRTAVDVDEVGTLDQFSLTYLLFRFFEDYPQAGSGVDQARGNDLERIRFLMTKLIGGDGSEILDLVGVGDGNIFNFALARRDNFSFGSGSSASQTFPSRAKSGALENTAFRFDLTAKQGSSTVTTVSGITVTASDTDRLFVGQQFGNIRLSGDPLERLLYRAEITLGSARNSALATTTPALDRNFLRVNKFVYEDDMTTGRVIVGTALRGYNSSNLLTYSEQVAPISGSWIVTNGSITATTSDTTFTNPIGGTSGVTKLRPTTTNRYLGQEITSNLVVGQIYNWSLWVRTTGSSIVAGLYADPNGGAISFEAGDTFTATGTWTRFSTNFTPTTTVGVRVFIGNASVWDTNEELFVWGAQLTNSTIPLAYFATTGTASAVVPVYDRYSGDDVENTAFLFNKSARRGADGLVEINTIDYNPDADFAYSSVLVSRSAADVDDVGTVDYWVINWNAALTLAESLLVGRYDDPGYRLYGNNAETVKFFIGQRRSDDVTMLNPQPQFVASIRKFDTSTVTDVGAGQILKFVSVLAKQGNSTVNTLSSTTVLASDQDRVFVGQQTWQGFAAGARRSGDRQERLFYRLNKLADQASSQLVAAGSGEDRRSADLEQVRFTFISKRANLFDGGTSAAILGRGAISATFPERRSGDSLDNPAFTVSLTALRGTTGNLTLNTIDASPDVEFAQSSVTIAQGTRSIDSLGMLDQFNLFYAVGRIFEHAVILGSGEDRRSADLERIRFLITKFIGGDTSQILDLTDVFDGLNYSSTLDKRDTQIMSDGSAFSPYPARFFSKDAKAGATRTVSSITALATGTDRLFVGQQFGNIRLSRDPMERVAFNIALLAEQSSGQTVQAGSGQDRRDSDLERVQFTINKRANLFDGGTSAVVMADNNTFSPYPAQFFSLDAKKGVSSLQTFKTIEAIPGVGDQSSTQVLITAATRDTVGIIDFFNSVLLDTGRNFFDTILAGSGEDRRDASLERVRFLITKLIGDNTPILDLTDIFDGLNYRSTILKRESVLFGSGSSASQTFPARAKSGAGEIVALEFDLEAKQGRLTAQGTGNLLNYSEYSSSNTFTTSTGASYVSSSTRPFNSNGGSNLSHEFTDVYEVDGKGNPIPRTYRWDWAGVNYLTANSSYTLSFYVRAQPSGNNNLVLFDASLTTAQECITFSTTGTFNSSTTSRTIIRNAGMYQVSGGTQPWYRFWMHIVPNAAAVTAANNLLSFGISPNASNLNFTPSTVNGTNTTWQLFGLQLSLGHRLLPYVATNGTSNNAGNLGAARDLVQVGSTYAGIRISGDPWETMSLQPGLGRNETPLLGSGEDRRSADLEKIRFFIGQREADAASALDGSEFSPYPARFVSKSAKIGVPSSLATIRIKTADAAGNNEGVNSSVVSVFGTSSTDLFGTIDLLNLNFVAGRIVIDSLTIGSGIDQRQTAAENIKFFITKLIVGDGSEILDLAGIFDGLNYRSTILKRDTVPVGTDKLGVMNDANANFVLNSELIGGGNWTEGNLVSITIVTNDTTYTNPVGGTTGVSLLNPVTTNRSLGQAINSSNIVVNQPYVWSVYLRSDDGATIGTALSVDTNGGTLNFGTSVLASVTSVWTRYSLSFTPTTTIGVRVFIGDASSWDTNETVYAWGAQVNAGTSAATYVKTTNTVFIAPLYTSRYSGDTLENTAFLITKLADAVNPQTVTMGSGLNQRQSNLERVSFLVGLPETDQVTAGSDLDQRQNLLENIKFNVGLRETHATTVLDGSEFSPYPARFFGKIAKQGSGTTTVVSGVTVTAAAPDRLFVGQQAFQGFAAGARRSGDSNERISFNVFKDGIAETREILQNFQAVWTARLNNGVGQMFEELTLLPDPAVLLTGSAKYEVLEATESIFVSRFLQILPVEQSGDLDPYGNINNMTSNGKLRMTNYVDIDYFEGDYVGESRSFT